MYFLRMIGCLIGQLFFDKYTKYNKNTSKNTMELSKVGVREMGIKNVVQNFFFSIMFVIGAGKNCLLTIGLPF